MAERNEKQIRSLDQQQAVNEPAQA